MDQTELYDLLKKLCEIPGPVGREEVVQSELKKNWEHAGFKTRYDKIGNLYSQREGHGKHWAIIGHADSIGFLVQQILPNGFLKLAFNTAATFPDARFLAGVPLRFITDKKQTVRGFFGLRSGHLAGIEGKKKPILFNELSVDIGVDSSEDVENLGIHIGTPAVFDVPVQKFQDNIVGPSMDNRISGTLQCAIANSVNTMPDPPRITLISTVQEEIGLKGAAAAANQQYDFDGVINIDVGLCGDFPGSDKDNLDTKLGEGPIILYKDFSIHYTYQLIGKLEKKASKIGISMQRGVFKNYGTDGAQFIMHGFPTAMIAVPCRYTHTYFETIRINDLLNTLRLLLEVIK